jgi:hypothetical protein
MYVNMDVEEEPGNRGKINIYKLKRKRPKLIESDATTKGLIQ